MGKKLSKKNPIVRFKQKLDKFVTKRDGNGEPYALWITTLIDLIAFPSDFACIYFEISNPIINGIIWTLLICDSTLLIYTMIKT